MRFFLSFALLGCFSICPGSIAAEAEMLRKPNVLFIVCDDLNTHIGCYGDPIVKTPNADRLAKRGVRFDHAYAQYPVCNPSRTSFLSGLHPETTGVTDQQKLLKTTMPKVVYLPEHFRTNGYFIASIGKIEHGSHHDIQWDVADEMKGANSDEDEADAPKKNAAGRPKKAKSETPRKKETSLPYLRERATEENDPENVDTAIAKRVVKLLEEKRDKPFFIGVGFHKPHVPHVAPKKFFDMYPPEKMLLAKVTPEEIKGIPPAALGAVGNKNYQPNMPEKQKREIITAYLACVSYVDEQLGVVMDAVDRLKLADDTIIIFTGDHGWHFGEHDWWAKASLFEPSARVPLIVVVPGQGKNVSSPRVVELLDLYPTLSELCGLPKPPQGEGKSFAPLLKNPLLAWHKSAFTMERRPKATGRTVRTERYRYTEWDDGRQGAELYDYTTDTGETKNLAKDPKQKETLGEMKKLLGKGVWQ